MKSNYLLIDTVSQLKQIITQLMERRSIGLKIESTGLDPFIDHLRAIVLSVPGFAYIIDLDRFDQSAVVELLRPLFDSNKPTKVFHNAKFALKFLLHQYGLEVNGIFDTMLASQLITAGRENKHSLSEVLKRYINRDIDDHLTSDWSANLDDAQLTKSAQITSALLSLYEYQRVKLRELELILVAALEFKTINSVAAMELAGMLLDTDKWAAILDSVKQQHAELAAILKKEIRPAGIQQLSLFEDDRQINLDSPQQLLKALNEMGIPVPNTRNFYLQYFSSDYPILEKLLDYRGLYKLLTSYGDNFLKLIHPHTGRIHSDFFQIGAATGRTASNTPNLQQIPKSINYRSCFIAPQGRKLIIADYSQIELRILAGIANDEVLINALKRGMDLHKVTASQMFNIPLNTVNSHYRNAAKSINYGICYGMGARGLAARIDSSLTEAEGLIKLYFNTYRGVARWLRNAGDQAVRNAESRTPLGRLVCFNFDRADQREVSAINRYGRNIPIQGSCADLLKIAMVQIHKAIKGTSARLVNMVHDELLLEVEDSQAEEIAGQVERLMIEAGNEIISNVPIAVDLKVAQTWLK